MNILKSLIVWLCFIPVAILNGGLREYVLTKILGEKWALPVSGIILSVCIFLITWLLLPRIIKALTFKDCWLIGICWGVLTIAFEFGVGLAGGNTASELLAAYNPLTGNLWLLILATTLLSPKNNVSRQKGNGFIFLPAIFHYICIRKSYPNKQSDADHSKLNGCQPITQKRGYFSNLLNIKQVYFFYNIKK